MTRRDGAARPKVVLTMVTILTLAAVISGVNLIPKLAAQSTSQQITVSWLDSQAVAWKPAQNITVPTAAVFSRASYGNLEYSYNTLAVEQADLSMLISTGVQCIRIDLGYAPWLQNNQAYISEMTSLVQQIRAAGKCLIIADAASESYRGAGQLTWAQFEAAWPDRVKTLASLYHPDYYVVIKEPGWYPPFVSDAATNPDFQNLTSWLTLTSTLVSSVLSVSPTTKVGVAIGASGLSNAQSQGYVSYLNGLQKIADLNFIGFDIYNIPGFTSTQGYLAQYGSGGKAIWIPEAWSGDGTYIFDSSRASLDAEWIQVLYYFAININATMIIPFYTDLFASYTLQSTSPTSASQLLSLFQQRTAIYSAFQGVAAEGGVAPPSTSSSTSTSSQASTQGQGSSSQSASGNHLSSSTTSQPGGGVNNNPSSSGKGIKSLLLVAVVIVIIVAIAAFFLMRRRR